MELSRNRFAHRRPSYPTLTPRCHHEHDHAWRLVVKQNWPAIAAAKDVHDRGADRPQVGRPLSRRTPRRDDRPQLTTTSQHPHACDPLAVPKLVIDTPNALNRTRRTTSFPRLGRTDRRKYKWWFEAADLPCWSVRTGLAPPPLQHFYPCPQVRACDPHLLTIEQFYRK